LPFREDAIAECTLHLAKKWLGCGSGLCTLIRPKKKDGQEYSEPGFKKCSVPQNSVSDPDSLSPDPDLVFQAEYRSGSGFDPDPDPIRIQGFDDQK
jgi:hypothetical protein